MSPNEAQLRAALREGAGKGVDADLIIANAERYRRARRQRITYAAAAVVVAAFVGIGGTLLANSGSGGESAGSDAGRAAGGRAPAARPSTASVPGPAQGRFGAAPKAAACPPAPTRVVAPVGTGPAQAGRLLPTGVSTITACAYPAGGRQVRTAVLTGARAQALATTLNDGAGTPTAPLRSCSASDQRAARIALLAADADGRRVPTVHVTVRCAHAVATNGLATRYLATVPAELDRLVR